jgi:hypothetical protein
MSTRLCLHGRHLCLSHSGRGVRRGPRRVRCAANVGYSQLVDQALMLLIFQQDIGVRLQRAINMEQYDIAQQIRERQGQVCTLTACTTEGAD